MKRLARDGNYKTAVHGEASHAVFSIATNGYEKVFAECIRSQSRYCQRLNVPYYLIHGSPPWGISAHDSSWLKMPALNYLLSRHSGGVLYLDADCEVLDSADDFRLWDAQQSDHSLFAALDFSHRLNGAVIYCRSTPQGRRLIRRILYASWVPEVFLPRSDRNLYENGHFIWVCKNDPNVYVLPGEWNSGVYRELDHPFIIHHGGTKMREASGEKPHKFLSRLRAAGSPIRIPFHMAWFGRRLTSPHQACQF